MTISLKPINNMYHCISLQHLRPLHACIIKVEDEGGRTQAAEYVPAGQLLHSLAQSQPGCGPQAYTSQSVNKVVVVSS